MFTSSADVFRTRQAVRDLIEVVHTHRAAMDRLVKIGQGFDGPFDTALQNGVLRQDYARIYSDILLAAATPDDDFNVFIAATAVLISDRLQSGICEDDLYWNWNAFRDHYRLASPPVRAALMNGFRAMHAQRRVNLEAPPLDTDCLTMHRDDILSSLHSDRLEFLHRAVEQNIPANAAGRLWVHSVSDGQPLSWPETAAFRYLYERPESLQPDDPEQTALIPWC